MANHVTIFNSQPQRQPPRGISIGALDAPGKLSRDEPPRGGVSRGMTGQVS